MVYHKFVIAKFIVFYYTSYEGSVNFNDNDDVVQKKSLIDAIQNFGQVK